MHSTYHVGQRLGDRENVYLDSNTRVSSGSYKGWGPRKGWYKIKKLDGHYYLSVKTRTGKGWNFGCEVGGLRTFTSRFYYGGLSVWRLSSHFASLVFFRAGTGRWPIAVIQINIVNFGELLGYLWFSTLNVAARFGKFCLKPRFIFQTLK